MHVPDPVKKLFATRTSFTVLALAIAAGVMSAFSLGWTELQILGYVGLIALVAEFWADSSRKRKRLSEVEAALGESRNETKSLQGAANAADELRSQMAGMEAEAEELRERLTSPAQSLHDVLAGLDTHLGYIGLVEKHRGLQGQGRSAWPVTSIHRRDEMIIVSAHIDDDADERFPANGSVSATR